MFKYEFAVAIVRTWGLNNMVLAFDYLDSMMWSIVASGVSLGIGMLRLPYKASSDSVEERGKNLSAGLAISIGATGLYLFITGMAISLTWPYGVISGGVYNVLFGGVAALGGLVLLAGSAALFLNRGFQAISYFAVVLGLYLVVDAVSILNYQLTKEPTLSALLYLAPAAATFLSVPATHIDNKWLRRVSAVFAFLFALLWLFFASQVTTGHLQPPSP